MTVQAFGILPRSPVSGERYDTYEPERYGCVAVDDRWVEPLAEKLREVPVCWHALDLTGKGLDACGITLLPPASIPAVLAALDASEVWTSLGGLLEEARARGRFVIHFGL